MSSFEMNKINPFLHLTAPFPLILFSNLFITFEAALLIDPDKSSLVKGTATIVSAFFI